jgi:hypothetical protein
VHWEVDAAFLGVVEAAGVDPARPDKAEHLARLEAAGSFRWVRELFLHAQETRPAESLGLLPLTFGHVARKLEEGASEAELGLDRYRRAVERRIGSGEATLWWSYRVRLAVK